MGNIPPWIDLINGEEVVSNCEPQDDGSVLIKDSKVTIPCSTYGEVCKVSGTEVVTEEKSANFDLNVGDLVYSVRTYNKVLTTEQKAKNKALDQKRFKYTPSASAYVKDGLVFQLDCKNGLSSYVEDGATKLLWKDLISGKLLGNLCYEGDSQEGRYHIAEDGSAVLETKSGTQHQIPSNFVLFDYGLSPDKSYSIEIVFKNDYETDINISSAVDSILSIDTDVKNWIQGIIFRNNYIVDKDSKKYKYSQYEPSELSDGIYTAYFYKEKLSINNESETTTTSDTSSSSADSWLSISTSDYGVHAQIYAVRIYDRELTSEEIEKNYLIDQMRFYTIPYVTKGLMYCWDCLGGLNKKIDCKPTTSSWKDIISGATISLDEHCSIAYDGSLCINSIGLANGLEYALPISSIEHPIVEIVFNINETEHVETASQHGVGCGTNVLQTGCVLIKYGEEINLHFAISETSEKAVYYKEHCIENKLCSVASSYDGNNITTGVDGELAITLDEHVETSELQNDLFVSFCKVSVYAIRIYDADAIGMSPQALFKRNHKYNNYVFVQSTPANALADDNGNLLYDDSGNLLVSDNN